MFSLQFSPPISKLPYILMILFFVAKIDKVLMESICLSLFLFPVLQRILCKQPCKSQCPQVSWYFVVVVVVLWTLYLEALLNLFILIISLGCTGLSLGWGSFLGVKSLGFSTQKITLWSQVWQHAPSTPAYWRQRQAAFCKLEDSQVDITCLKKEYITHK